MIDSLRTYKDAGEVALIRKAVDASVAAHFAAFNAVKPDVNEREISALMQYEWGKRGCERPAYAPIVGSGFYSTVLHYSDDDHTMKSGDVVVIDAAGEYSMYASDITRTLPINGHFTARQREIYDIVLGAQHAAEAAFKSGESTMRRDSPNSLYKVAYDYINTHGKDLHGEPLGKYFIHGLGHPVGLNVHDATDPDAPLGPGQVFTIEPGIYIPEENLGVRIEDDYYVAPDGKLIKLSAALTLESGRRGKERWQENKDLSTVFFQLHNSEIPQLQNFLRDVLANIFILRSRQLMNVAVEDDLSIAEDQETQRNLTMHSGRQRHHAVGFFVELMSRQGESVLQAMGHQKSAGMVDVALLQDQFNNRVRGHGIKASCGRIVKQQLGLSNDRPGNGHAPPHASGKFRGKKIERVFQFHKAQRLSYSVVYIFVIDSVLLGKAISNIFAYRERVE